MTPPLAHRLGTRLIRLGVLLHGYGTLLLVRRTRPARVTMTHGGVTNRRVEESWLYRVEGDRIIRPGMERGVKVRAQNAAAAAEVINANRGLEPRRECVS